MRPRNAPLPDCKQDAPLSGVYHVTCVTHNSRESERMKKYKVKRGDPVVFTENDEIYITKYFADLVRKNNLKILAYSICRDHIHFVIICDTDKLVPTVQNLKSVIVRKFNERRKVQHLWAQKFNRRIIEDDNGLENVLNYVQNNRMKHDLEENEVLQNIINRMVTPIESLYD